MKQCDDISALSRELDIDRRLLYRWRDQIDHRLRASGHHLRPQANPLCVKRSANSSECWGWRTNCADPGVNVLLAKRAFSGVLLALVEGYAVRLHPEHHKASEAHSKKHW